MMCVSEILVRLPKGLRRVRLERLDTRRRVRLARRLAAMGWARHAIRRACRFTPAALKAALKPGLNGLWGRHAALIAKEMSKSEGVV